MADEASELLPKAGAENARKRAEDGTPRGSPTRGVPVPAPQLASSGRAVPTAASVSVRQGRPVGGALPPGSGEGAQIQASCFLL